MNQNDKIYVAGHKGLVGSAILRTLEKKGFNNLIFRNHSELDLAEQSAVREFFRNERPDYIFLAAAKVGGIHANTSYPADFIRSNILIQANVIDAAYRNNARKLLFLGSSCIYPRFAPQPIKEEYLLNGELETTNEWYAVAKIAGIKMCQAYRRQYGFNAVSIMPTNLYGPGDNFDLEDSHVLPALIRRFHEAKAAADPEVAVWGTGNPKREFMHVDDLAAAALFLMENYDQEQIINAGTGSDITIKALAELIKDITGYEGKIAFDPSKPDGTPRKLLDISRIRDLGWTPKIALREGIESTYRWFLANTQNIRR